MNPDVSPEEQALLEQLHDVVPPQVIGWWPPAFAWWVVMALVLCVLVMLVVFIRKRRKRKQLNRWRRDALSDHQRIANALDARANANSNVSEELAALSVLMRRVSLALLPRSQVAALTDDNWLNALDDIGQTQEYSNGVGQSLRRAPYKRSMQIEPMDALRLIELTETTIKNAQPINSLTYGEPTVAAL